MAETIETISAEVIRTIARVELFTDATLYPDDWRLVVHFEDGFYQNGILVGKPNFGTHTVSRRFGDIKDKELKLGENKITIAQLAGLIKSFSEMFRKEDEENPAPGAEISKNAQS